MMLVFYNIKKIGKVEVKGERPELTTGRGKEEGVAISLMMATSSHMVREGIHNMLQPEQNIEILANASNHAEIIPLVLRKKPDVLIIDTAIPELNIQEILESISEKNTGTRVLLLLRVPDERFIVDSISMGVKGCLSDTLDRAQFIQAITTVSRNKIWVELEVVTKILTRLIHSKKGKPKLLSFYLTRREEDIAKLVVKGYSNKKISSALLISEKTVKSHLRNIFKKLGVSNRFQLALEYHDLTTNRF
jgi:DNA-binding NarL/FixJ family response regulator